MEPPDTCYVDSGGASIAYHEFGSGAIELVFVMFAAASHLEVLWEEPPTTERKLGTSHDGQVLTHETRATAANAIVATAERS